MGTKSEMLANTIKQKFSGDVSMYKNTEIPKEISPDTLSETICSNWEDLNTDLIEEWIKDRKNHYCPTVNQRVSTVRTKCCSLTNRRIAVKASHRAVLSEIG